MGTNIGNYEVDAKDNALRVIREFFAGEGIDIKEIIFFGSRARGDFNEESDWDFLVIVGKELEFKEKRGIITLIKRKLAKLRIPNDIIVQSKRRFDSMKDYPGSISYVANLEGITELSNIPTHRAHFLVLDLSIREILPTTREKS